MRLTDELLKIMPLTVVFNNSTDKIGNERLSVKCSVLWEKPIKVIGG